MTTPEIELTRILNALNCKDNYTPCHECVHHIVDCKGKKKL